MVTTIAVAFIVCAAVYCLLVSGMTNNGVHGLGFDCDVARFCLQALAVPAKHLRGLRSTASDKLRDGGLIAKPVVFVFLNGCVQPTVSDTLFYWMTDDLCNMTTTDAVEQSPAHLSNISSTCTDHGPMFNQVFISHMDCAAYVGFILGIVLYNKCVLTLCAGFVHMVSVLMFCSRSLVMSLQILGQRHL